MCRDSYDDGDGIKLSDKTAKVPQYQMAHIFIVFVRAER